MSIILKVTPDVLQKKAESITSSITSIETELKEIQTVLMASRKYWEGDASDTHQKYAKVFGEEIPTVAARLKEHPKDLLAMADIYIETEKANEQVANRLPANVIL